MNPPPTSLPITSLWVIPMHQPQACCTRRQTWTGDSILTWPYTWPNLSLNMNINHVRILHHLPGGFWGQIRESGLFLFECRYVWSECHTGISVASLAISVLGASWPSVLLMWQPWGIQWFYSSHFLRDWMLPVWTIWEQLRQPSPQLPLTCGLHGVQRKPTLLLPMHSLPWEFDFPLPPDHWLPHLTHPLLFPNRKQLLPLLKTEEAIKVWWS